MSSKKKIVKENKNIPQVNEELEIQEIKFSKKNPKQNSKDKNGKQKKLRAEPEEDINDELEDFEEEFETNLKAMQNAKPLRTVRPKVPIADDLVDPEDSDEDEVDNDRLDVHDELDDDLAILQAEAAVNEENAKIVDVAHMNVDMNEVNLKIQNLVETLSNFKEMKDPNKSRTDYVSELKNLMMIYYDYNSDLIDLVMNLFPPNEVNT